MAASMAKKPLASVGPEIQTFVVPQKARIQSSFNNENMDACLDANPLRHDGEDVL
jgi:hypothetical protein